jgi:hypothetical protein
MKLSAEQRLRLVTLLGVTAALSANEASERDFLSGLAAQSGEFGDIAREADQARRNPAPVAQTPAPVAQTPAPVAQTPAPAPGAVEPGFFDRARAIVASNADLLARNGQLATDNGTLRASNASLQAEIARLTSENTTMRGQLAQLGYAFTGAQAALKDQNHAVEEALAQVGQPPTALPAAQKPGAPVVPTTEAELEAALKEIPSHAAKMDLIRQFRTRGQKAA